LGILFNVNWVNTLQKRTPKIDLTGGGERMEEFLNLLVGLEALGVLAIFTSILLLFVFWWLIFKKAGFTHSWIFGFLMVFPLLNIIMFFIFVFSDWPIEEECEKLRRGR